MKVWRVPWTEVRRGTEFEEADNEWNEDWADILLDGNLGLLQEVIDAAPDSDAGQYEQGVALMDDVLIAFDMLGWKVVCKNDDGRGYPILRNDDFVPDWCDR